MGLPRGRPEVEKTTQGRGLNTGLAEAQSHQQRAEKTLVREAEVRGCSSGNHLHRVGGGQEKQEGASWVTQGASARLGVPAIKKGWALDLVFTYCNECMVTVENLASTEISELNHYNLTTPRELHECFNEYSSGWT